MKENYKKILTEIYYKMYRDISEIIRKNGYAVEYGIEFAVYDDCKTVPLIKVNGNCGVRSLLLNDTGIYVFTGAKTFILDELCTDDIYRILSNISDMSPDQIESCMNWKESNG